MVLQVPATTSSPKSSPPLPPRATAQDGSIRDTSQSPPRSPALSLASTADGEHSSPVLPPLPAPTLPDRVLGLLRTPPSRDTSESKRPAPLNWDSPYPENLRRVSLSSEPSEEDEPIHQLEIETPFLRPAPFVSSSQADQQPPSLVSAAVLAKRAKQPVRGLTEDWIRQHTAGDSDAERRHWLSDGTGDSENSSVSGSLTGRDAAWLDDTSLRTPRAAPENGSRRPSRRHPRQRSSVETLRQEILDRLAREEAATMATDIAEPATPVDVPDHNPLDTVPETSSILSTPKRDGQAGENGPAGGPKTENKAPVTPSRSHKKTMSANTPRLKKKVPWKGKTVQINLPRDEDRGMPGHAPKPLTSSVIENMLNSWEELGYDVRGFDLQDYGVAIQPENYSQSRGAWPSWEDIDQERLDRNFRIVLPDLNAWKKYVDDLNEAKLRALGVSFGDEEPPAPSISPGSTMSRQASVTQYPPLPFSPPLPTSSASSSHALQAFPFPSQFNSSAMQSPGIPSTASPVPFGAPGKYNPRASISIPSPHGWSPQFMMQQGIPRGGSPSLANLNAMMSPTSPFSPDGMPGPVNMHQRHQSLQFPMVAHQFAPARQSPRLQDLQEIEEEPPSKSPSKTPEPTTFIRHNASDSLQREIDEAEYHLEEQFREQLDNDEDYSPHNELQDDAAQPAAASHARGPSVQFAAQLAPVSSDSDNGPVLHHPRPHSRGHSLSQKYFTEEDASGSKLEHPPMPAPIQTQRRDDAYEIETNPSNLGTPIQPVELSKLLHQRSFSAASNPWSDAASVKSANISGGSRRPSHGSKPSFSKLNVQAPEFKFDPSSSFKPSEFVFGGNAVQPTVFQAGTPASVPLPQSETSSQFSFPTGASKINVNAPVFSPTAATFSPGQSDFSFSTSGPKFRPDAPTFMPSHSLSDSLTSPMASGNESTSNRASSIFGNIDLSGSEVIRQPKKSKAIPIVRPSSRQSPVADAPSELKDDSDGRLFDESRFKRVRGSAEDADDVPQYAPRPQDDLEATPVPEPRPIEKSDDEPVPVEDRSFEDDVAATVDTTFSSTMVSETTDTRADVSEASPADQQSMDWSPFELKNNVDIQSFNEARPWGHDSFKRGHKNSLSATAKDFVPGASLWTTTHGDETTDDADEFINLPADEVTQGSIEFPTGELAGKDGIHPDDTLESVEVEPPEVTASAPLPSAEALSESRFAVTPSPKPTPAARKGGLSSSRFASSPEPAPARKPSGLSASRFAAPEPEPEQQPEPEIKEPSPVPEEQYVVSPLEAEETQQTIPLPSTVPAAPEQIEEAVPEENVLAEPSMDDIDAIMRHLNANPSMGVNKTVDPPQPEWHHPSPTRHIDLAAVTNSSPLHLPPHNIFRSDAPSPSPRQYRLLPGEVAQPLLSTELEDPFVDPPHIAPPVDAQPPSDWEGAFSEDEQAKLEARVNFFDGHVNDVVGSLLASRLGPLEQTLANIQHVLSSMSRATPSSRRERRSMSAEIQNSDADDEDDEVPVARRSMSPRRDKRMEQVRAAVMEAFATQQRSLPPQAEVVPAPPAQDNSAVFKALEELKEQFGASLHLDFRGEDLRNIVEDAVERRMPPTPKPVIIPATDENADKLQARVVELEQLLHLKDTEIETEISNRRKAEDRAAEMERNLQTAETRLEVEIMNKSAFDVRVADLEDRLQHETELARQQTLKTEAQVEGRRDAEDRLSEIQRLLRISSEEEMRLREIVEEREQKVKVFEAAQGKASMRLALLEASQTNAQKTQSENQNRINAIEHELREARKEAQHWRAEAERLNTASRRHENDLAQAEGERRELHKLVDTLGTQLEEHERVRDTWRSKFISVQEAMSKAAREITEENARRSKKEQALLARQEVLDAKLQAEARTRERIEAELERLELGERQGMRAVAECKRLETLLGETRTENHKLQQNVMRYQAEFQEARESGAREVQRTRDSMQTEVEEANHQVNVIREELEDQLSRLRGQLDQVKLDADTSSARHDMLLEEAQNSKKTELEDIVRRHQNELEELQARYERQLGNTTEDAQRSEQNLLERLSISTSKCEHLQDKVNHLEDKLDIAKEAALAAAQAARSTFTSPEPAARPAAAPVAAVPAPAQPKAFMPSMQLPEKISPQALRESIMVLQEQLQEREQTIEELQQTVNKLDPDAANKISKRDDEIIWLRELLAVRHSDLQDIIAILDREEFDKNAVKDAAIRLKANLQMEEQERERAMNGGSAINLPNLAASLRDATPRVAQAVGPLAAAWGNWRKNRDSTTTFGSISSALTTPAQAAGTANSTPSKNSPSSLFGGLMTPPASGLRQTPPNNSQPTAFSNTGRRFTPQDLANRPRGISATPKQQGKMPATRGRNLSGSGPVTPPMMRPAAYDSDAQAEDFDDAGFFDD